jgi:hypothetical protein
VQDQSEGTTVACGLAKAGEGIDTIGLSGDAKVTNLCTPLRPIRIVVRYESRQRGKRVERMRNLAGNRPAWHVGKSVRGPY